MHLQYVVTEVVVAINAVYVETVLEISLNIL